MRVQSSINTVLNGRSWNAGQPVDVSETEIDTLGPHILSGVLVVLDDPTPAVTEPPAYTPPLATGGIVDPSSTPPLINSSETGHESVTPVADTAGEGTDGDTE